MPAETFSVFTEQLKLSIIHQKSLMAQWLQWGAELKRLLLSFDLFITWDTMSSLWNSFWISDHMGKKYVIEHNSCFLPKWSMFNPLPQVFFKFLLLLHDLLNLFSFCILFLSPHCAPDLCFANPLHFSTYKTYKFFPRIFSCSFIIIIFMWLEIPSV